MHSEQILFLCSSLVSRLINGNKILSTESIKKILVIKLDEIGDMIYMLHVLEALKEEYPEARIDVMSRSLNISLVESKGIENVITDGNIPGGRYDVILDMRGTWGTMFQSLLRKCRFRYDRGTIRLKNKLDNGQLHERITNWEIAKPILDSAEYRDPTLSCREEERLELDLTLQATGITKGQYALMHTGARDPIRRWPAERFLELSKRLFEQKGMRTVICGGPEESAEIDANFTADHILNLAGETNLLQLSDLCAHAKIFIGNESGPLHFAVINKTPLVGLFGAGVKDVFYPYNENQVVLHKLELPLEDRLKAISVDEVWNALPEGV